MNVRVRSTENGNVIGVPEALAESLCVSGAFEVVVDDPKPVKSAASKPSSKK